MQGHLLRLKKYIQIKIPKSESVDVRVLSQVGYDINLLIMH